MIASQADEMHRIEGNLRRWQSMSEQERDEMRQQMKRFRELPVEERRELLDRWLPPAEEAAPRGGPDAER